MLQDNLWEAQYVVVGDHVVWQNQFWKVVKITKKDIGLTFSLRSPEQESELYMQTYTKIRVRPCGSSSRCEEV